MGASLPQERKSYTKIKNFTEKDQVRIKYSKIGADKKLMLSVYIGEDVYKELTGGVEYKRINFTYIPGDMIIITPTNDDKGLIHRYNGSGMFKTTCVRISLGKFKDLKLNKRDSENRVVEYSIIHGGINEPNNALRIDISNSKKIRFTIGKRDRDAGKWPVENNDINVKEQVFNTYECSSLGYLAKQKVEAKPIYSKEEVDRFSSYNSSANDKLDMLLLNQECLSEKLSSILELLNVKEKQENIDTQESIFFHKRIAIMEVRISKLEKQLETMNSKVEKSLFERIFGK